MIDTIDDLVPPLFEHFPRLAGRLPHVPLVKHGTSPRIIPAGGSCPLGVAGYVNVALELKKQIVAGEMPEPDFIYIPLGSIGTAAGLTLGVKAAGLRCRIIAIRVIEEKDDFAPQRFDFFDDITNRPADISPMKPVTDAEVAFIGTAPAHLHGTPADVAALMDGGAIGSHDQLWIEWLNVFIQALKTVRGKIPQEPWPTPLRVPADDGVRVRETFLGLQGGMHAAEHHG